NLNNTHQIKVLILKKINGVLMLALLLLGIINILIILISLPQCAINFSKVICYLSVIYRFFYPCVLFRLCKGKNHKVT
ncbi:hypothetical protein AB4648_27105, partial [Vibrio splendidus]